MAEKLFYTMGEVSEMFDVKPSLLRYWEEQFPTLRPKRNKKGNRLYSPQDVEQLKTIYHLVKEREPYYEHTMEGADDMPAHAKCSLFGVSLTIPITDGRLNLGTWQGIYLCEFRNYGGPRKIVATIYE